MGLQARTIRIVQPGLDIDQTQFRQGDTGILQGKVLDDCKILAIAAALSDPTTDIAKGVNGAANVLTAQICKSTNQQPTAVCTSPGVVAAAATLK